jgi:uncharacterized membrane protein
MSEEQKLRLILRQKLRDKRELSRQLKQIGLPSSEQAWADLLSQPHDAQKLRKLCDQTDELNRMLRQKNVQIRLLRFAIRRGTPLLRNVLLECMTQ